MRVWTVREWHCTGETDTLYVQIIEVVDNQGPSITSLQFHTYHYRSELYSSDLDAGSACVRQLRYNFKVTVAYPGGFANTNGGFYATLPVGVNLITYTAYDQCYNSSQCTLNITVQDLTPPVAVCDQHTVVSLTLGGPSGLTLVDASVFDDGRYDACSGVTFRARR